MELSAGKFIDFTNILWLDVILNAVLIVNAIGLMMWIVWGVKERRQGVRAAVRTAYEKSGHARGWKPRTRWIMAGLALAGAFALMILGAILKADSHEGGALTLGWGVAYTALWLVAGPFLRPVTAPRPPHSRDWAPASPAPASRPGDTGTSTDTSTGTDT
ncbi:hypothetical protein [Streptomyces sp. NPDC006552]|uniref:hypothetical protein n=1 Tax=Streptomyces sp. NPDC006552 TaxID=3157179 RepID=UPI0033AA1DB9